jgi:hypothetical protein
MTNTSPIMILLSSFSLKSLKTLKTFKSLFVPFIVLFASCLDKRGEGVTITVDKFPVNMELASDYITVHPVLWSPAKLFVSGDYFIVRNLKTDTIFSVFSYPDFEYLFSDGVYGNGPEDFQRITEVNFHSSKNGFSVFFPGLNVYREIIIDDLNKKLKVLKDYKYQLPGGGIPQKFTQLDDSLFVYINGNSMDDNAFYLFDATNNEVNGVSLYPHWVESVNGEPNFSIYNSGILPKPDGSKFAAFYCNFKRWRLFDGEGNLLKDIEVNIHPVTKHAVLPMKRDLYYGSDRATDKYIYAVCLNRQPDKPRHKGTELQVWNWEGEPVAKFILDRKFSCFTVSGDSVLYVADNLEGDEDKIFKYILPLSKK